LKSLLEYLDPPARARRVLAVYWVLLAIGSHLPNLGLGKDSNQFGVFQVDKTLHVLAFSGLTWLLFRARVAGSRSSWIANAIAAACVAGVYAMVDEYTQRWTGRDLSVSDVVAGMIGIVGVFLILTAPPPRDRASGLTVLIRVVTAGLVMAVVVVALAPQGNHWVNRMARPFFQPWPGIDKAEHFYVSAVLTLLLALSSPAGVRRPRRGVLLTILAVGLSGPIIETAQSFTGRGVEMADLYAHQVGLLAAMLGLAVLAVGRAIRMRRRGRSPQDG
jgi:VanZ family protein